jgi:hypothetical protein
MADLIKLIQYSGPSVLLILAGLIWGKKLIEYFFDETIEIRKQELNQDLENYKGQIERESKDFQHQLDTRLNEFNIRFSTLHQERADVIKELYNRIVELQSAMLDFTRRGHIIIADAKKEEEGRLLRVNKALEEFNNYFLTRKIFFQKETVNKLENLSNEYWDKGWDLAFMKSQFKEGGLTNELRKEYLDKSRKISETVEKDFAKLIEELENEFRKLLGVE